MIATFRALCAISKRQTVMSQELLICENNIMQLSHFHIQDIKDSMSLFYYLYLWTFHSDYLMYHLILFIVFPLFEFLYIRSEIIETITLTSLEKRPIIEISTKNLQLSWNFEVYDIILFISGKLLNLPTSIDQYLCTNVNRQSLIRRPASAQNPSSKANTVHIRLVRNISVNSWDCCYRWDSSNKFRTLHQLAFPSLESHFAGP